MIITAETIKELNPCPETTSNEWENYLSFWKNYASEQDRIYFHNIFNRGGQL